MDYLQKKLLAEATRIGDRLIASADIHDIGLSWLSVVMDADNYRFEEQESIYNGTCGIALFLIELYKRTGNALYLETACRAMERIDVLAKNRPSGAISLLTGLMSGPFVLLQLYEITKQQLYVEKALSLAEQLTDLVGPKTICEFINGLSGTILGLIHLHAATNATQILQIIDLLTGKLLELMQHDVKGVCWDQNGTNVKGLCGFSHGAAGIGFVFLELGHYLKNDAFYWIAEQAFQYEQSYYDEEQKNWQDLRRSDYNDEERKKFADAYVNADMTFFTAGRFINAWCHGAAGIGLSRLRAYELLGKTVYRKQAEAAITATHNTDMKMQQLISYTLCHGSGGNAEIFLEASRVFKNDEYIKWVLEIAERGLKTSDRFGFYRSGSKYQGEDPGLFMGIAGIGYFYLRAAYPDTPSVLMPRVDSTITDHKLDHYSTLSMSTAELQKFVIRQIFPKTLSLIEDVFCEELEVFFAHTASSPAEVDVKVLWIDFMEGQINKASDCRAVLKDIFGLELTKWKMINSIRSYSLLKYKAEQKFIDIHNYTDHNDPVFQNSKLVMDKDMLLFQTNWNWQEYDKNNINMSCNEPFNECCLLLIPDSNGRINEIELSLLSYRILSCFAKAHIVIEVAEGIVLEFTDISPLKVRELRTVILKQIHQLAKSGFLMDPQRHLLQGVDAFEVIQYIE